jgi:hypothetical protein
MIGNERFVNLRIRKTGFGAMIEAGDLLRIPSAAPDSLPIVIIMTGEGIGAMEIEWEVRNLFD